MRHLQIPCNSASRSVYIYIVSQQNKIQRRGADVGHDNAVYVLPQNDSPFLQGKWTENNWLEF